MRYLSNNKKSNISSNFECGVTLENRAYLRKQVLELEIKKITFFISIREVSNKIVQTNKYIIIIIYIIDTIFDVTRIASLIIKVHLVDNLKVNILINIDTIISQEIIVNLEE